MVDVVEAAGRGAGGSLAGKIGLIGDVHAEDALLETALDWLLAVGVERILCTGDIPDGAGSVARCCALLRDRGVVVVRGNHERWLLAGTARTLPDASDAASLPAETREYLQRLPLTVTFDSPLGGVLLCHGLGDRDMAHVAPDDYGYALEVNDALGALIADPQVRWVVNGHTHRPMVRHFEGLTLVNAGTLHREHSPGCLLLDFDAREVVAWRLAEPITEAWRRSLEPRTADRDARRSSQ